MKILLTGATGFVGRHLAHAFEAAGHEVRAAVRHPSRVDGISPTLQAITADYTLATRPADWQAAVEGMDAVVNAVGILRESRRQPFELLHQRTPIALFDAAAEAGVRRIIQISALGADEQAFTPYQISKKAADDHLATLGVPAAIIQPSVIFGEGSASAQMFRLMAQLPLIPLPGDGQQALQPIHIDDLADAVVELLEADTLTTGRITFVGPEPLTLREFLTRLRRALGVASSPRFVSIPLSLVEAAASVGNHLPSVALDRDTLAMLNQGSVGSPAAVAALLRRAPRGVQDFTSKPNSHR